MRLFERQIPEALDLMGRALRAGHAFPTAVKMVGDEMPEPIAQRVPHPVRRDELRRAAERGADAAGRSGAGRPTCATSSSP